MAGETLGEVIRRLGRSGGLQRDLAQTDAQLLDRFARRRDEPAFAALVARHGPAVLGVCRRLLTDARDAEDAFQAVFLVLARRAGAVQRQSLLGPWLYGVAWRVALRLRGRSARRRERERSGVDLDALPADDAAWSDVRWVVHEEVQRLPDVYRSAVVLCCLEGKSNEEAARLLRRPVGTVKSRLTRARELLRARLTRRGLAVSSGVVGAALAVKPATASAASAGASVRAALPITGGGAASARAVALSQGVLRTMFLKKAMAAAVLALVVLFIGGAGGLAYRAWAAQAGDAPKALSPAADKPAAADAPKDDRQALQGVWRVAAVETEGIERDDDVARDVKKQTWTIRGDELDVHIEAPGPSRDATFAYSIDATRTPKTIDLTSEQAGERSPLKNLQGVYSVDGDVLKFCYAMTGAEVEWWYDNVGKRRQGFRELKNLLPAGPRPTEVATRDGSKTMLLTLKRVAADKDDAPKERPPADSDAEKIQGTWVAVSAEMGGKPAPAEAIKDFTVVVTADTITFNPSGENRQSKYKLDPTKTPKVIELTPQDGPSKGTTVRGLYELDGDSLKLCVQNGEGEEPKGFATKPGSDLRLLVLKRKPADEKPADKPKDDAPSYDVRPAQGKESVEVSVEADRTVYVITGGKASGGSVTIRLKAGQWPRDVTLRLSKCDFVDNFSVTTDHVYFADTGAFSGSGKMPFVFRNAKGDFDSGGPPAGTLNVVVEKTKEGLDFRLPPNLLVGSREVEFFWIVYLK